jgi:hypothetical protein
MLQRVDLSRGKAVRVFATLLMTAIFSLGLAVVPAHAGHGRGGNKAWKNRAYTSRFAYATYRAPIVARTTYVVPRTTARVYYAPAPFVRRTVVPVYRTTYFRTTPVYYTPRYYTYRSYATPFYLRTPVYYRTSRYYSYPSYYRTSRYNGYPGYYSAYSGYPVYRERRSVARDVLTVVAGTGAGAIVGGLLGGKRGAAIGAFAGAIGGAALTAARDDYRYGY